MHPDTMHPEIMRAADERSPSRSESCSAASLLRAPARRRPQRRLIVAAVSAVSLAVAWGCAAPPRVESVVLSAEADFAKLRSFYVVPATAQADATDAAVAAAIERELTSRGDAPAAKDVADMWLVYRASALDLQRQKVSSDPDANAPQIVGYVEGTLAIDVFDREGTRRIWHGQAVFDANTRKDLTREVGAVVQAILAELPDA